ncbi:MAG: hypothetical protein IJJ71_09470 [Treponema sp.]|uniref:hypothetical protein n=1 Tax=Treponema sp. TaxID=166 RepID=UPI0025E75990|nr:hypothetical protein [Treponema sp.]MBR0496388.1 hypothetical protein [Treponema sp.]
MKNLFKTFMAVAAVAMAFGFASCKNNEDDDDSGPSVLSTISANVESTTVDKGGTYKEDVSVDLTSNPLSDSTVAALNDGSLNPADLFRQSSVSASSSRAAIDTDSGLESVTITLKEVTKIKITVEITATTPNDDCSVLIEAVISGDKTDSGKPVVSLVKKVDVGNGAGKVAADAKDLSGKTIPKASELAGKKFQIVNEGDSAEYYEFSSDGKTLENLHAGVVVAQYDYDETTGKFSKKAKNYDDYEPFAPSLFKIGDTYFLYEFCMNRVSGSGLDSVFAYNFSFTQNISGQGDQGGEVNMATVNINMNMAITTTSAGALTGAMKYTALVDLSAYKAAMLKQLEEDFARMKKEAQNQEYYDEEYIKQLDEEYASHKKMIEENMKNTTETGGCDITGVYTNKGGLLCVKGKSISTEPDKDDPTKTVTEVEEFDQGAAIYDGTHLYIGNTLKIVGN